MPYNRSVGYGAGTARVTDVFIAPVGFSDPGVEHPAVFPLSLAEKLIQTFSAEDDLVLDPFCGSSQT
jgi:site-specific DNA-methyltransferase (adenine-specific)